MAFNLLDSIKALFNNDIVSKAATLFGEGQGGIQKAISAIVPAVLGGALFKSNAGDAAGLLGLAKSASQNNGVLSSLQGLVQGNTGSIISKGSELVKGLLGDKTNVVTNAVADYAGIKESSASSLLGLVTPVALGKLGEHAEEKGMNAAGLSTFLSSQKDTILGALPAGFSLGSLGLGSLSSVANDLRRTTTSTASYATESYERKKTSIVPWLLVLALLVLAAWFFLFRKADEEPATVAATTTTTATPATPETTPVITTRESFKVKLPNGTELDAYKGGIEDKLVAFLQTNWTSLGADSLQKIWFDFDDLTFNTGSAELTTQSQHQVDNLTAILKAFPAAKLKIGGYTDKTGNEAANKKLSADRALAVKTALEKNGVGSQVAGAEGYGSDFAKYPAEASERDRETDRRVSVSVRQ